MTSIKSSDLEAVRLLPEKDGKRPATVQMTTFLLTAFFGVPAWLAVLLPLSIVSQIPRFLLSTRKKKPSMIAAAEESKDEGEKSPKLLEIKPLKARKYDVVLLGCTGFTGGLAADYLAKSYGVGKDVKWAIAGRSQKKLDGVKESIAKNLTESGDTAGAKAVMDLDTLIVDTSVRSTLHKLADNTRAVITTAGPFAKYGSSVVEFCAKYGTSYVDITGETDWARDMITAWEPIAQQTGAKIISLCGNDSIPWDITVFKLAELLRSECNDDLVRVECYDEMRGGVSGGTVDTALSFISGSRAAVRYDKDPYLKLSDGSTSPRKTKNKSSQFVKKHPRDVYSGKWNAPFVMSGVNCDVVRRTHALTGRGDTSLSYDESVVHADFKTAFVNWFGPIMGVTALLNPLTGGLLKKYILPKPGEGPTEKQMVHGYLLVSGYGVGVKGNEVESVLYFPADPGYRDTARMIVESGLCLAFDADKLPVKDGGFYSPAAGMGDALLERLCNTGCRFASRVVTKGDEKAKNKL